MHLRPHGHTQYVKGCSCGAKIARFTIVRVAMVRVREGQDWKLYRDAATLVMVRVAAAVVRQDWKLHRLYDTGNSKGCSEAGLEADIATFAGSLNPPSLLSPTSLPLSRAEREI